MPRRPVALSLVVLACAAGARAGTGRIVGTIGPPGKAIRVGVVERLPADISKLNDRTHWGTLDAAKGTYVVDKLAPKSYDLVVLTKQGRIDGVHLKVRFEEREATYDLEVASGTLTTERFDLSPYIEEGQVVTDAERAKIVRKKLRIDKLEDRLKKLLKVSRFMDTNRALWIHGTRRRAVVLMELVRADQFYAGKKGETIWRIESWPFLWMGDVWHKPRKGLRVWQRKRMQGPDFAAMGYVFDPRLGGIEVRAGQNTRFDYTLPPALPAALGKTPR